MAETLMLVSGRSGDDNGAVENRDMQAPNQLLVLLELTESRHLNLTTNRRSAWVGTLSGRGAETALREGGHANLPSFLQRWIRDHVQT